MARLLFLFLSLGLVNASTTLSVNPQFEDAEKVTLPAASVKPGKASLSLDVAFPKGWHLNADAPLRYSLDGAKTVKVKPPKLPLKLEFDAKGKDALEIGLTVNYCQESGKGVCKTKTVLLRQPLKSDPKASAKITAVFKPE